MRVATALTAALSAALAMGCGGGSADSPAATVAAPREVAVAGPPAAGAPAPAPPPYSVTMDVELKTIVEAVLKDAAKRTGRDQATLQVISLEAVTWNDGGMGCPQPGVMYTMALVPGHRIVVRAGDQELDYHANRRGYFVLCPPGRAAGFGVRESR